MRADRTQAWHDSAHRLGPHRLAAGAVENPT